MKTILSRRSVRQHGRLVAAAVAATAATGPAARAAAWGAVPIAGLVVALVAGVAGAVAAPAPAARVVEPRLAAPGTAAETAAREHRLTVHAVMASRGEKVIAAAREGAGFGPLTLAAAFGCRRGRLLLFEGLPHDLVHEVQ